MNKVRPFLRLLFYAWIFLLLTIISQIGGIILLITLWFKRLFSPFSLLKRIGIFSALYLLATFILIPNISPFFGRIPIKDHPQLITQAWTVLLNRNYVTPKLNQALHSAADQLEGTDIKINCLDANFPFINGFPLLPHLSHDDGKKIDIALIYQDPEDGSIINRLKSHSGYGVFEPPLPHEKDQINQCIRSGFKQYSFPQYLTFGKINQHLSFSSKGNKALFQALLKKNCWEKIFIEPHLAQRLGLQDNRIRYHGCKAVRHDDHIHLQVK
ncbi:hypothetical protein [Persicobacter diffluens]|uniref:Uncharacterized protein n=1 Tax=Persicobacter diffluens TaxID=981 RepID=A0AAN5AJB5_9BACT|nr:hypothetical protein PEDI_12690 [Persicobacter diffluens]